MRLLFLLFALQNERLFILIIIPDPKGLFKHLGHVTIFGPPVWLVSLVSALCQEILPLPRAIFAHFCRQLAAFFVWDIWVSKVDL